MFDVAFFIGALVPTFLISRLMLWVVGKALPNGPFLAIAANVASLVIASLILWLTGSFPTYAREELAAQAVWLVVDLIRVSRRASTLAK
ncbi:hypothetical protein [Bradyrhizobium sp.]|uniref:hypothetical protein n=1 Tax=Bradyrhizobium sp. TaxID=376 RepID=UPI0026254CB3|nr:hypothetical protein [Bradyrhizobium sp.]